MFLLTLAAIASTAISEPTINSEFMREHFPRGVSAITFLLDREGKVVTCEVLDDDKSEDRKAAICEKTIGKTAGNPALGPDGEPVYGYVTGSVIRVTGGKRRSSRNLPAIEPDITLLVSSLPDGAQSARVGYLAYIDESGLVRKCRPYRAEQAQLLEIACLQSAEYQFPILEDSNGKPVSYVNQVSIGFEVESRPE